MKDEATRGFDFVDGVRFFRLGICVRGLAFDQTLARLGVSLAVGLLNEKRRDLGTTPF
ncbi:MAG: hypothetical protein AB8B51_12060 [Sedimentitalea sp.]